jgi:hypothetical protein
MPVRCVPACVPRDQERRAEIARLVRTHSTVEEASGEDLLEAVEAMVASSSDRLGGGGSGGGDARVLIAHIYDDDEAVCQLVNHRLDVLSAQPEHRRRARFLRVRAGDLPTNGGFDRAMYPAFNVYAPGAPVRAFVAVTREVGMRPTAAALEQFFVDRGVLTARRMAADDSDSNGNNAARPGGK